MAAEGATVANGKLTLGSLRRAVLEGDLERGSFMAGQVSGLIKNIRPVKKIIEELFPALTNIKIIWKCCNDENSLFICRSRLPIRRHGARYLR